MKLLIAEDEPNLAEGLKAFFEHNNLTVDIAHDGEDALELGLSGQYDTILLDIMMPKKNGLEVLKELRSHNIQTPILMLTALGEKDDRIRGLDFGADDYLPKPFETDELLSRVRALLRRNPGYHPTVLKVGDLSLDPASGLACCGNKAIKPGMREFQILEMFMNSPGRLISADQIMEHVWGWDADADISVVWVHISNLRKKLSELGSKMTVRSSRGMGYLLEAKDDSEA